MSEEAHPVIYLEVGQVLDVTSWLEYGKTVAAVLVTQVDRPNGEIKGRVFNTRLEARDWEIAEQMKRST